MDANQDSGTEARRIVSARWPAFAQALTEPDQYPSTMPLLELDRSGPVTTLCANGIRLASAWAPDKEAELQIASVPNTTRDVTLFGVGMGYLPPLLLSKLQQDALLTVVPLNLALFNRLLSLVDMHYWLDDPRVQLRLADSYERLPVNAVVTPPVLQMVDTSAERVRDWLLQHLSEQHVQGYQQSNESAIETNMAMHLQHHADDPDVGVLLNLQSEAAQASSRNALVIGAGPSLELSAPTILELQQQGSVVIAVDGALVSLMNRDIIPDLVLCIDPLDYVKKLFAVDFKRLCNTSLVYFPTAQHEVISNWPWQRYSAIGSHSRFESFTRHKPSTVLYSSGSVIHPAVDLAVRMGATQVYLAGADFGFPDRLTHVSDSPFAADRASIYADGQTVRNYRGEEMASQINFISYFRDLEQYIGQQVKRGVTFHNLGDHSAMIQQVNCVPLAA
jgi:hypothetical protein